MKKAAYLGARMWMMARDYSDVRHPVVADVDLTWEMMKSSTVVLYGNGSNNSVLADIGQFLPIKERISAIPLNPYKAQKEDKAHIHSGL